MDRSQGFHADSDTADDEPRGARWVLALILAVVIAGAATRAGMSRGLVRAVQARLHGSAPRTVLRVWDWWAPSTTEAYARYFGALETEFEQLHPEVDVQFQFVPFGQYEQKMATAMVGSSPPDVFQSSVYWAEGFFDRGMLLPLNPFLERERQERARRRAAGEPIDSGAIVDREAFLEAAWRHNTKLDGTVFGVPQILDSSCLIWNLDILQKAARSDAEIRAMFVRRPDGTPDWNQLRFDAVRDWQQFRGIVRRLTVHDDNGRVALDKAGDEVQTGFVIHAHGSGAGPFDPWCASNGGRFQDPQGTRALFADARGVEAMNFLLGLYWNDRVSPAFRRQLSDYEVFEQRKSACFMGGTWSTKYIVRDTEGWQHFDMTPFPPGPRGRGPTTLTWGNMLVIARRSQQPDLAWEYIKFVTSLTGARRLLKHIEQNSPRRDFYQSRDWEEACRRQPSLTNVPAICASGIKLRHTQINAVDDQVKPAFETLMLRYPDIQAGKGPYPSVAAGLQDAAARVTRVYDRYNAQVAYWHRMHQVAGTPEPSRDREGAVPGSGFWGPPGTAPSRSRLGSRPFLLAPGQTP
jgi:multiple sugar transport system substrate-binding protein